MSSDGYTSDMSLQHSWRRLPDKLRKTISLLVGGLLLVAAVPIGVIPGPGGTVVFLLGIAVLSSEFRWADRLRRNILGLLGWFGRYIANNPLMAVAFWTLVTIWLGFSIWYVFIK